MNPADGGRGSISARVPAMNRERGLPWWVSPIVILGALLTAMGAVIALVRPVMLVSPHDEMNGAVHIYAGYMAARNFAVAFMLLALLFLRARRALGNLMVLVGLIQVLDTCMDIVEGRWAVVPGVLLIGVVFLIAAARVSDGFPFWRVEAWNDQAHVAEN